MKRFGVREVQWRESFLRVFGPGFLGGMLLSDWLKLLGKMRFAVSPSCWPRAMSMTSQCFQNSLFAMRDRKSLGKSLEEFEIPPPLFIIGHWRSGTTHLHNLLALDGRFAYPNNYQALFPHSFLTAESMHSKAVEFFLPKRRPMDNIEWSMQSAQEDEFALCIMTFLSPYMGWITPPHKDRYEKYLTFREASAEEMATWKSALTSYLKKLTWKHRRPLILKSPPHTARIKLLLQLFPRAKFLHIHRDPYTVFASTKKMLLGNRTMHCLQSGGWEDIDEYVLRMYRLMHDAFFEEKSLIPEGQYHEIAFAALEQDPLGELHRAYQSLQLPDFEMARPEIAKYLTSIAGYEKNNYAQLPDLLREQIDARWRPSFDAWGY
jgi:omega-hydroxy-beta-dihydromenaquinone-9 sulfotransferase